MSNFNPYVQGWAGAAVPRNGAPPSIFGALPTLGAVRADHRAPPLPDSTTFLITHFRPNILNASVVGPPNGQSYFRILTDPAHPTRTSYQDAQRRTFAVVDWTSGRPTVEMPGLFARQSVRSWLQKSSDQSSRHMEVRGIQYRWAPVDAYICLFLTRGPQSQVIARIHTLPDGVHLEMTSGAMQYGLLEVCVLTATIFLSGYSID